MALISKRLRWLQVLYPPAEAAPPNPGFLSDDIVLTHAVMNGTDRLPEFQEQFAQSGLGSVQIISTVGPAIDKYHWVFGASVRHNDPVARELFLGVRGLVRDAWLATSRGVAQSQNIPLPSPRGFIIPPRCALIGQSDAIAAGQRVIIEWLFIELDLGEPHPAG